MMVDDGSSTRQGGQALPQIGRGPVDLWTVDECKPILSKTHNTLMELLQVRKNDQNFLKGLVKFCDRVKNTRINHRK